MGFLGDIIDSASRARRRKEQRELDIEYEASQAQGGNHQQEPPKKKAKIFTILSYVAIVGLFIDLALVILGFTHSIPWSARFFAVIGVIGVICLSSLLIIPWIRYLIAKEYKVLSIVFLSFVGVCTVLWILTIILAVVIWEQGGNLSDVTSANILNIIKASILITIQFCVASSVADNILKYKKKWIVFQVIMYLSELYIDFYATSLVLSIDIKAGGFSFIDGFAFLFQKWMWVTLLIAFVYLMLASSIMNKSRLGFRRRRGLLANTTIAEEMDEEDRKYFAGVTGSDAKPAEPKAPDTKERLTKLKEMLDQGLITQEEYDEKRKEILKDL